MAAAPTGSAEEVTKLSGAWLRGPVIYRDSVTSTMDEVRSWAEEGAPEGSVVVAAEQSGGRGRQGRRWECPAGDGLLFSVLLRPELPREQLPLLATAAGVAVATVLRAAGGLPAQTKWPNDIYCNGAKVAGILVETPGPTVAIIGVGVNLLGTRARWTAAAGRPATSLEAEGSSLLSAGDLLTLLLNELDRTYTLLRAGKGAELVREQTALEALLGQTVRLVCGTEVIQGTVTGLAATGALILSTPQGPQIVRAGEVEQVGL